MELTGGIHMIDGVRGAHAYLVPAANGLYVLDTGMPGNAARMLAYVKSLGRKPKDVSMILLAHADMDHAGSAAELKRRTGAKIAIHRLEAPVLAGVKEGKRTRGALGVLMRVFRTFMKMEMIEADVMPVDGEKVGPLTVIAAPGHTEGTVCFFSEAAQALVTSHIALELNRPLFVDINWTGDSWHGECFHPCTVRRKGVLYTPLELYLNDIRGSALCWDLTFLCQLNS